MFNLFILMLQRCGLIIVLAYLLMNIPYFRTLLNHRNRVGTKLQLIIVFGLFALISNYTGVEVNRNQIIVDQLFSPLAPDSSLANTRVLSIGVSGLIGGPLVGTAVGIISAVIRYWQGGADVHIYVISSILVGIVSGLYGQRTLSKSRFPRTGEGFAVGALMELLQMTCILLLGSNQQASWDLVLFIAIPMVFINSLGTAIFLSIIESTLQREEHTRAVQTHDVLELANATMPFFRSGLTEESSTEAARIIKHFIKVAAVSITDQDQILAHVGIASDHHKPAKAILTDLSREVLRTGEIQEAHTHEEIGCTHPGCPLEAALVIPLKSQQQTIGTLKLYFTDVQELTYVERQLAEGLGNIFSSQLELGEMELQGQLLKEAEIKSLQAQVNPHFFFNAINTISALIRVDSEEARELLIQLSHFFRSNLQGARASLIPLHDEMRQVQAFLKIESARFPDRFQVNERMAAGVGDALVPPFLLQILVENALKHAFKNRKTDNEVDIQVRREGEAILLEVRDNGFGIEEGILSRLGKEAVPSEKGTGTAVENLNQRLISLFGEEAALEYAVAATGTTVSCRIPYRRKEEHGCTS